MTERGGGGRGLTLVDLPDELLTYIFIKLDYRSLARVEECCKIFRRNVHVNQIWKRTIDTRYGCLSVFLRSQYGILVSSGTEYYDQSFLIKCLVANVSKAAEEASAMMERREKEAEDAREEEEGGGVELPILDDEGGEGKEKDDRGREEETLIHRAIEATSTDHPEESIHNVLSLETRVLSSFFKLCYWSSKGSENPMAGDALVFKLKYPLAVVSSIQIRPFEAHFQRGSPIYAPMFVRFSFGDGKCETTDLASPGDVMGCDRTNGSSATSSGGLLGWNWTSKLYPMAPVNSLQEFKLSPTLCCGGYVRVELLGRTQKQEIDNLYYVCLSFVKVLGKPVLGFNIIKKNDSDQLISTKSWDGGEDVCVPSLVYGAS
ncbi:F-box domain-containing protein [Chloropicon primus]|nr:F-box domain-containing protein [Chloropicon primus]